jgi:Flp pilus assembly protein TadG
MTTPPAPMRCHEDRGSVMPMATVLVIFLMIGAWALVSASQQWNMRREVHAVAAAAARAGAQSDPDTLRAGAVLDPAAATRRAQAILAASGYSGAVTVDGSAVTVTVTGSVVYAFPSPGFPDQVTGTASAIARRGVTGTEGG